MPSVAKRGASRFAPVPKALYIKVQNGFTIVASDEQIQIGGSGKNT